MSGIGTKNVKAAGSTGGAQKSFGPGNVKAEIYRVELSVSNYKTGPKTFVKLFLETEPVGEGFEGWLRDKDDESKGRHLGQTAIVKSDNWGYADKKVGAMEFTVVDSVVGFIKGICEEIESDWCDKVDGKFKTIEEFVEGFNNDAPFKGKMLNWCIAATKELDDKGYPKYWPYLPTLDKVDRTAGKKVFASDKNVNLLLKFDPVFHIYQKAAPAGVQNFTPPAEEKEVEVPWKNDSTQEDPFGIGNATAGFEKVEDPFAVPNTGTAPAEDDPFAVK